MNALAHAHLELGVASPFLVRSTHTLVLVRGAHVSRVPQYTPRPHSHPTLASIRAFLKEEVGARIASEGTPKCLGPIVFGVTGYVFSPGRRDC